MPTKTWTVASNAKYSPVLEGMTAVAGALQCITKFTANMKVALNNCLYEESLDGSSGITFQLTDNMSVREDKIRALAD